MSKEKYEIRSSPLLKELEKRGERRSDRLVGWVGDATDKCVRLHPELDSDRYWEIPRDAILSSNELDQEGYYEIFVSSEARIRSVSIGAFGKGCGCAGGSPDVMAAPYPLELQHLGYCIKAYSQRDRVRRLITRCRQSRCDPEIVRELVGTLRELEDIIDRYCVSEGPVRFGY